MSTKLLRGWLSKRTAVSNVVHIIGNSNIILLHNHSLLATVYKDKELPEPLSKLFLAKARVDLRIVQLWISASVVSRMDQTLVSRLRMSRKYNHLLSLNHLVGDEIVAV